MAANVKNEAPELNVKAKSKYHGRTDIHRQGSRGMYSEGRVPSNSKHNNATMATKLLVPQISHTVTGVARSVP